MKRHLPYNKVHIDYQGLLGHLTNAWVQEQGDNIISIFITGSYARGDATEVSDIDIWVILKHLDFEVLNRLGITSKRHSMMHQDIRINPQCFSLYEVAQQHFDHWLEGPVKVLDAVLIYGEDLFYGDVNKEAIKSIYKKYLVDILMSVRHYISEDASVEKLTYKRLNPNILKPLLFSLRMERYCETGHYPLSNQELLDSYTCDMKQIIAYSLNENQLTLAIGRDHKGTLKRIHDGIMALL